MLVDYNPFFHHYNAMDLSSLKEPNVARRKYSWDISNKDGFWLRKHPEHFCFFLSSSGIKSRKWKVSENVKRRRKT